MVPFLYLFPTACISSVSFVIAVTSSMHLQNSDGIEGPPVGDDSRICDEILQATASDLGRLIRRFLSMDTLADWRA